MNDTPIDKKSNSIKKIDIKLEKALSPSEEIDLTISQSNVQKKKGQIRKKQIKIGIISVGILFLIYGIYFLFVPYKGTMAFGICKVFLELNVRYPNTLRINTVEEIGTFVRIWYTQTDSFGEYRMEPIQCYYKPDEKLGFILDKVTVRRREVDPEKVNRFNKTIPIILQYPPDLTLPTPLPDSLSNL